MIDIYIAAYRKYPPAQQEFGSLSVSELQELASSHAIAAQDYDPHETVHEVQDLLGGLVKFLQTILIVIIIVGILVGAGTWVAFSRGLLQTLDSATQLLIHFIIIGGDTFLILFTGSVLLYIHLLSFNSLVVQTLNKELAIWGTELTTRDDEKLAGFALWNSSLNGGIAIKLLAVFSSLWLLSVVSKWDPYEFVKTAVIDNIDVFSETDGVIDATKRVLNRLRRQENDGERTTEITIQDDS